MKEKINQILSNKIFKTFLLSTLIYLMFCNESGMKIYSMSSWFIYFITIIIVYKTNIKEKEDKKNILIISTILSLLATVGDVVYYNRLNSEVNILSLLVSLKYLQYFLGWNALIYTILGNIYPVLIKFKLTKQNNIKKPKLFFTICFLIILISWVPYFLNFYPGTLSPDSLLELQTIINNFSSVSDHHPVLHIIFIAIPFKLGMLIFDDPVRAVALSTFTQMIIMALIFAKSIIFLQKRKVSTALLITILCFYALMPAHGYYSIVMWKDVIFSGTVLLLTMELIKIYEYIKKDELTMKKMIPLIIISLCCVFFRNNAIYMYFVLTLISLLIFKRYRKILFISFAIVIAIFYVIKGPIFNYLDVKKSASAEYIGMPLQQIGRMAFKNVEFTEEEQELIDKLIPVEIMKESYNPNVSDGIKFNENYNGNVFDENKIDYLKLWIGLVYKHPTIALEAYLSSTLGYWYPGVEYWSVANNIYENNFDIETSSKFPATINKIFEKIEARYTPILNIEWSIGLCFWVLFISGWITFKKKGIKGLYPYIPIFGIWLTMMIASPVFAEYRYVYSAYTCLPILLLFPYIKEIKNKNDRKIIGGKNESKNKNIRNKKRK